MEKSNIVLITVDCLRPDHLSCLNYGRETTPGIDELAEDGVLFTQALSNGPQTRDSFPAIMTSTYSFMNPDERGIPAGDKATLAEVLKGEGYATAGFHSVPQLSKFYSNYDRGFESFEDFLGGSRVDGVKRKIKKGAIRVLRKVGLLQFAKRSRPILGSVPYEEAEGLNKTALSWLENNSRTPFFLWMHYMDPHEPYMPPRQHLKYFGSEPVGKLKMWELLTKSREGNVSKGEVKELIELYDAEIRYADEYVGKLLDRLKEQGIYDETVIALTADHGEAFGEHGKFGHGADLYDELLRVPLIIKAPRIPSGTTINRQVELLDLAPTILDLAGLPRNDKFLGKSILPLKDKSGSPSKGVISETMARDRISYRTKKWKFILKRDKNEKELYDLKEDPQEQKNIYEEEKEVGENFEQKTKEHLFLEEKIRVRSRLKDLKIQL